MKKDESCGNCRWWKEIDNQEKHTGQREGYCQPNPKPKERIVSYIGNPDHCAHKSIEDYQENFVPPTPITSSGFGCIHHEPKREDWEAEWERRDKLTFDTQKEKSLRRLGFRLGYRSRDEEIDKLKAKIEWLTRPANAFRREMESKPSTEL